MATDNDDASPYDTRTLSLFHRTKAVLTETRHVQKDPNHQPDTNHQPKQANQEVKRNRHHDNPTHQLFRSLQEYRNHPLEMDTAKPYLLLTPGT